MSDEKPLVSIVCPAFQEEEVLPLFHRELATALNVLERVYRFEVIYVDDGSSDRTLEIAKELARHDPRISYLSLSRNFGHQAALTAGLEHARGDAVISIDADLQHPTHVLAGLLAKWRQGHDIVITIRADDERLSLFKRLSSSVFYRIMGLISDTDIRLAASDFRLMSRRAVNAFLQMRESHRFVRGMVQWLGFKPAEIAFTPDERRAGQSKYTLRRMMRLAGDGVFSFSRVPLRLAVYFGLLAVIIGLGHSAWWLVQAIRGVELTPAGFEYLTLATHLLGGGILCAIGIVGEYVGRVFDQVKGRPVYVLKDESPSFAAGAGATSKRREAA
jgi:glycosyltransferase involved in cell wall biosynthesis